MSVPTSLEAQPFVHAMHLMSRELARKNLNIVRNVVISTLASIVVYLVQIT